MESFKVVAKIKYKNDFFYVLISKSCQIYFLKELADGSVMYPTETEFLELNETFNKKQALAVLDFNKRYEMDPKIIARNRKLISLLALLLLTGCSITRSPVEEREDLETTSTNGEAKIEYVVPRIEDTLMDGGYDFHSLYNYENERLYRVHIIVNATTKTRTIECQDFEEFSKYIDTKIKPTYDEVIETVNSNPNITGKYKKWLLEGLANLKKNAPDLDLTVLNFNFARLQLQEKTEEELAQINGGKSLAGLFDPQTGIAYFISDSDPESNKFVFFHEVFGHGMSEASFERDIKGLEKFSPKVKKLDLDKEKIEISTSMMTMRILNNFGWKYAKDRIFSYIGQGFGEGLADQIAKLALDKPRLQAHPYIETSEQFRIMTETVGMSLNEYISMGGTETLSRRMQENDVDESLEYIMANDVYVTAMKEDSMEIVSENETFKANIMSFFRDYADDKISRGSSKKQLINKLTEILLEGGSYIRSTFTDETIDYKDMSEGLELEDFARIDSTPKEEDVTDLDNINEQDF